MISAAGLFDIPIDRYHHDPNLCDGPSISASGLKQIVECPAKYWAFSPYNPRRFEKKETKALDIGRAAHALVLGEPEFARHFVIAPYDNFAKKPGYDWYNNEWKPAVEDGREARTLLKPAEFDAVEAMAAAQRATPSVMQAFERGKPEQSLLWKDHETGVWLKARPDWLPDEPMASFLVDYKTALSIEPAKLSADAYRYGYHVQASLQMEGVYEVLRSRALGIAHVVQEKDPPYLADLRMFPPEAIEYGHAVWRKGLRMFADCMSSGKWPAYTNEPQYFLTPAWVSRQMEEFDDGNDGHSNPSASARYSAVDYADAI